MDKAKDFEKGFEEYKAKKKQEIEELGQDIYDNCPDLCENGCGGKPCYKCIAEALHRDNYRKIPENAVVLTEEELHDKGYRKVCEPVIRNSEVVGFVNNADYVPKNLFLFGISNARKKTAEKFARLVEFHSVATMKDNVEYFTISALGLKEILHEEFGIPYDEICKEFTGDNV